MSLRTIIGRAGSGKTTLCLDEIKSSLKKDPSGDPIIYLVPDQMTFLSEYRLVTDPEIGGMIRTQVYSFSRLALRILQETGGISRYHLNSVGMSMLIRKIIDERKDDLKLFQKAADKNGFIQQMEQMMTEFKRYCIRPEELVEKQQHLNQVNDERPKQALQDKLHDLELIYRNFEAALEGKYTDSEDYFRLLTEKAASSRYLQDAEVYIDGFYSFTPQEFQIISELMKHCRRVTIAMTLDEPYIGVAPDELHLFRMSAETCQTIHEIAKTGNITIEPYIQMNEQKRWEDPSLKYLEAAFDARPAVPFESTPALHICRAVNRRAEIEGIAREIRELVRAKGYRYRDIAILMRNGHSYQDIIETVFYDYELPAFISVKRTMLHHPLVELIRSTLEVINGKWRYEPVFRAIKSDLLFPLQRNLNKMREQMDQLENFVLAYGIQGDKWTKKDRWHYRRIKGLEFSSATQTDAEKKTEQMLNELRLMITAPIIRLSKRFKKADSGRKLCEAIYLYLEELEIPAKLEQWKFTAEEKGDLVKAREHDQAWNAIVELLDQYVEMLGEEKVNLKQFASIMDAGLESLEFSLVPPAIDQVLVADLEKSRLSDIKVAFIIGLNEGVLPAKIANDGILAEDDREMLQVTGLKVAPGSRTRLLDENFLAYKAFTTPSEILYLSYPFANEEGKGLMPSSYIKRMTDMFPAFHEHAFVTDPSELTEQDQLNFVSNGHTSLSYLTAILELNKRNYPVNHLWWDVYNFYMEDEKWKNTASRVLSSLFYENKTVQLSPEVADDLYGETIQASVSRMEMFHSCPFSHYVQHGLKLRDRQIYRLEAPDIGDLFHAALKQISEMVNDQNISWAKLTRSECEKLAKQAVDNLAPKLQNQILLSSERHHYIKYKLEQIITRASFILSEHAKVSGFSPVGLEVGFGANEKLNPLQFNLKNGHKMELVGRIDRVDKAEDDQGVYLRVIDYKSSEKDLNLGEVYYGLALQMLTYLDIIIANSDQLVGKKADPAGVLYFHVHNPMIDSTEMLGSDEIEEKILKKFKMKGLVLGEHNVIRLMDQGLETGESQIISAGINKKDGGLSKRSKIASKDQFDELNRYVRNLYVKTGNEILDGKVEISPYKLKEKTPCTFCSFKSVCQFDQSVASNEFRSLTPKSNEEVFESIKKEASQDE
ncbi:MULTISPECIES: helicase-exonuclease AddAB subunit AddB [unclassified Bacillus (in: firmicutes)]|uniref:helicase-exonuclease AddAB subunit AddB n=1 Tax=unclassified Bacillus (in: firmicutes) TaxID=185979 RepID=UPI0008DFD987|nr:MULTISPECIES: helicase-exonuclease AddAB subunit AddB [unclassified Bacillus (in: firmicutes)]SFA79507.1 DNA helicase/exodeoxyribonuclease V, subunit B [Bacillus sp. UNCCL13]SFQ69533.1 DNA helicase/exodeoxyribonuclease V, subunit B [Bacillus sp. cl95]